VVATGGGKIVYTNFPLSAPIVAQRLATEVPARLGFKVAIPRIRTSREEL
jgi:hypothetical protein